MANAGPMVRARLVGSGVMSRSLLTLLLVMVVVPPLTRAHFTGPMPLLMRHGWGLRLRGAGPDSAEIDDDDDIGAGEDDMMVRSNEEGITSSLPPEATDNYIPSDDDGGDSVDEKFEDETEGSYKRQGNSAGDAMEDMDGDGGDEGSSDTEDGDRVGNSHAWGQDPDELMDSEERVMVDFMKRLDGKLEVAQENQELFDAAEKGDVARALACIEAGAGINAQTGDVERFSALHIAAMHGHVDLVRALVDAGADLYLKSGSGDSALHLAAHGGSEEAVSLILSRGVDVNIAGFGDTSPLFNAVEKGMLGCVSLLCDRGADVNRTDDWSSSPLHLAAMHGHLDICTKLAGLGSDIEAVDWGFKTPLHIAAENGHTEVVSALIKLGADLEARAENDMNALEWAEWRNMTSTALVIRRAMGLADEGGDGEGGEGGGVGVASWADVTAVGQYALMRAASKQTNKIIVRSGKRKGMIMYTDAAGRLAKRSQDTGMAIGRPSNAGVCHLKNKQCRFPGCTLTAYFGDAYDGIRRFCIDHRREDDIDLKEKGLPVPDWGGSLPLPWQL